MQGYRFDEIDDLLDASRGHYINVEMKQLV